MDMPALARSGLSALFIFVGIATVLNLFWELAQLPLYTIWNNAPLAKSLWAALHCTFGDLIIASWSALLAILAVGRNWPKQRFLLVAVMTIGLAVLYTIFSEWLNVNVRRSWAYSSLMPTLPWLGTGVAPLLQWIVTPSLSFILLKWVALQRPKQH